DRLGSLPSDLRTPDQLARLDLEPAIERLANEMERLRVASVQSDRGRSLASSGRRRRLRDWAFQWVRVHLQHGPRPELLALGREWLSQSKPWDKAWGLIWEHLIRSSRSSDLLAQGWAWMDERNYQRESFERVWRALWDSDSGKRDLLRRHGTA